MTPADFRRIALSFSGAEEGAHMGAADFRVNGRIFATLAHEKDGYGNLMLDAERQVAFVAEAPELFLPVHGGWGRMGATHIRLALATEETLRGALHAAWKLRIQKNEADQSRAAKRPAKLPPPLMIRMLLVFALFVPMAHTQETLASYTDRNRVLLLFAPDSRNPVYQQQLSILARHRADVQERDVVVLSVLEDPAPPITPNTLRVILGPGLPDQEQLAVRHRFHISPAAFTVLLIGKDGGEKFRSAQPVPIEKLNGIIDGMPMRQQEMRAKAHGR